MSYLKLRFAGHDMDDPPRSIPFPSLEQFAQRDDAEASNPEDRALRLARDIEDALNDVQRRLDDVKHQLDDAFRLPSPSNDWPPTAA